MNTTEILIQRERTHGSFRDVAKTAQALKDVIHAQQEDELSDVQSEALDLIATKIARIVRGNPNEPDHWKDISGYASLVVASLELDSTQPLKIK